MPDPTPGTLGHFKTLLKKKSAEVGSKAVSSGYGIVDGIDTYIFKGITPGRAFRFICLILPVL